MSGPWIIREMHYCVEDQEGTTFAVVRDDVPLGMLMTGEAMPIADCYAREDAELVRVALEAMEARLQ